MVSWYVMLNTMTLYQSVFLFVQKVDLAMMMMMMMMMMVNV